MAGKEHGELQFAHCVPQSVRALHTEHIAASGESRAQKLLDRLLTSDDGGMRALWNFLQSGDDRSAAFFWWATEALSGPQHEANLTPTKHRKLTADLQRAARKLAALVKDTSLDGFLDDYTKRRAQTDWVLQVFLDALAGKDHGGAQRALEDNSSRSFRSFAGSLEDFARAVPGALVPPHTDKPGNPFALRNFFARRMTAFFERFYRSPHRKHVLAAANAVFLDQMLDERELIRIAPSKRNKATGGSNARG